MSDKKHPTGDHKKTLAEEWQEAQEDYAKSLKKPKPKK